MDLATKFPSYKMMFVGHSLGSALASLAAVNFASVSNMNDKIWMVLFGTPRVGNKVWMEFVNSLPFSHQIYRIGNKGGNTVRLSIDPILHLPPSFLNYYHHLRQYQIEELPDSLVANSCTVSAGGESETCLQDFKEFNMEYHKNYYNIKLIC